MPESMFFPSVCHVFSVSGIVLCVLGLIGLYVVQALKR